MLDYTASMARNSISGTALDPTIQFAEIELDGGKYRLAFSYESIVKAEAQAGVNLMKALYLGDLTATQFSATFWAALSVAHPNMTLQDATKLMSLKNIAAIRKGLTLAWGYSAGVNPQEP